MLNFYPSAPNLALQCFTHLYKALDLYRLYTVRCAKADRELHQVLERGAPSITRELAEALWQNWWFGEDEERRQQRP